jgi:hypothetical protein
MPLLQQLEEEAMAMPPMGTMRMMHSVMENFRKLNIKKIFF